MRLLFWDCVHYTIEVLLYLWATPFAALVAGGVAVIEKARDKPITKRAFIAFVFAYLMVAGFAIWRDERKAASEISARLTSELAEEKRKNSPLLTGRIEQIAIGTDGNLPEKNTTITMVMSIGNQGTPSIAENWTVLVEMPNGPIELSLPYVPGGKTLLDDNGKPLARFTAADLIFNKTETVPIPTGSRVRGIVFCSLRGYSRDEFMQADPRLTVRFHDVTGKLCEAVYVPGTGQSTRPGYFPGIEWGINPADSTPTP